MLEARGLRVDLGRGVVLDGVDLELQAGDFLAIVGPNGAGKTTLVRCMAGMLAPDGGQALLAGRRVNDYSRRELARLVAYAPQDSGERFGFTVREGVLMGRHPWMARFGKPSPEDEALARAAMEAMDVAGLADRPLRELSGGERRRAALARTLAQAGSPPGAALLLDEPAAGLDIRHALACMKALAQRAGQGAAVAVVLHDLNLAAMFCPRMLMLKDGRVAAHGPTDKVLTPGTVAGVFGVRARVEDGNVRFLEEA